MAVHSSTQQAANLVELKESIEDEVYNIDPTETPFVSSLASMPIENILHQWETDTYRAPGENAKADGDTASFRKNQQPKLLRNTCQIFDETSQVSGSSIAVATYGRTNEQSYQLAKRGVEVRLDVEWAHFNNGAYIEQARDDANDVDQTARKMAGARAYLHDNVSVGTKQEDGSAATTVGVAAKGDGSDAPTDASDNGRRKFNQTILEDVLQSIWTETKRVDHEVYLGPNAKRASTSFVGNNNQRSNVMAADGKVLNTISVYETDWGNVRFQLSRYIRSRDALVMDMSMSKRGVLREMQTWEIAKVGDADRRQLLTELTYVSENPKCNGAIYDLSSS